MYNTAQDDKRALNIIWNASDDYSIEPQFKAYDKNGEADIYWNYIIGAVHKYYDYTLLRGFFIFLKQTESMNFMKNFSG